ILLPLIGTALALLSACIPSLYPFYTDEDLTYDSKLLGSWGPRDAKSVERWVFTAGGGKVYQLDITDNEGKTGEFEAHLLKLDQHLFLDLTPHEVKTDPSQTDMVNWSLVAGHLLVGVYQIDRTFKMAFLDVKWLENFLKANPSAVAHRMTRNQLVLTAGTRQLQQFVLAHLGEKELFESADDASEMERKSDQPSTSLGTPKD